MNTYRYEILLNETLDPSREYSHFDGYRDGAHLENVYQGTISAISTRSAANKLFEIFNIDHPSDYQNRSLSVGDVIALTDVECNKSIYACENISWKELSQANLDVPPNSNWTTIRSVEMARLDANDASAVAQLILESRHAKYSR